MEQYTYENPDELEEHNCDNCAVSLDWEYKSLVENEVPQYTDEKSARAAENCDENSAVHLAPAR